MDNINLHQLDKNNQEKKKKHLVNYKEYKIF